MQPRTIGYWLTTGVTGMAMLGSGLGKLTGAAPIAANIARLGYPSALLPILGSWMVAGGIVVLLPKLPLVKEWAYAGIVFAMTGAFASHLLAGDPVGAALPPLVIAGLALVSYVLRPDSRRLASTISRTQGGR